MRDRMERFVLLPFAVGCMSESSVGVTSSPQSRRSSNCRSPPSLHPTITRSEETERHGCAEEELSADECSKSSSWSSLALPKPNLSVGMDRLFKGFKTFSNLFVYKEEEDEEEEEMEIEIGVPTDVKHVTHIGWDGCAGVTNYPIIKGSRNNWPDTLDFLNNERALQLLSKFNDHHQQQLPHPPSSSSSSAASIVQLEGSTPQTDRQDQTKTTGNPDDRHHLIAADQISKEIGSITIEGGKHNQ